MISEKARAREVNRPRLAVTMGDPGGIGPEVILKALSQGAGGGCEVIIYGSSELLAMEEEVLMAGDPSFSPVLEEERIHVIDVAVELAWSEVVRGPTGAAGAILQGAALDAAMEAVAAEEADAIVTAPWNKALFAAADQPARGHTEVLAEFFGVDQVVMMLTGPRLRVALVTTHVPLREVASAMTAKRLMTTMEITADELTRWFGINRPRLALCGLNPHAGESGHMGREEIEVMQPVVKAFQAARPKVEVVGPLPSDTLFAKFRGASPYDAVVCPYHDQALIPLKLLHFGESANLTLGLPAVRTSVDHGTAYDIAGQGIADPGSMAFAMRTAHQMVKRRRGQS